MIASLCGDRLHSNGRTEPGTASLRSADRLSFEDNDLRDNARGAWDVAAGVGDRLVRQRTKEK